MIPEPILLNVDLWEAWIDLQPSNETKNPTLYVIGDVYTNDYLLQPYFSKRQNYDDKKLILDIEPGISSEEGYVTEVMFAEELNDVHQYASIEIYANGELVAAINEIEQFR